MVVVSTGRKVQDMLGAKHEWGRNLYNSSCVAQLIVFQSLHISFYYGRKLIYKIWGASYLSEALDSY